MDDNELQKNANIVKEIVLETLVRFDEIEQEKAERLMAQYAIVLHQRGALGKWIDKAIGVFKKSPDKNVGYYYRLVRVGDALRDAG